MQILTGHRHPRTWKDNTPTRWREGRQHVERHVPPEHPPHRPALQRISHPKQHRIPLSLRGVHPDAQGVRPGGHPAHLMDVPHPRSQQAPRDDRAHDLVWSRTRVARRTALQPHRLHRPGCCRHRECSSLCLFISRAFRAAAATESTRCHRLRSDVRRGRDVGSWSPSCELTILCFLSSACVR